MTETILDYDFKGYIKNALKNVESKTNQQRES